VTYKLSVMVYHCLHATDPRYLSESSTLFANVASRRHLRSDCLTELFVSRHKLSRAGRRAFSVAARRSEIL